MNDHPAPLTVEVTGSKEKLAIAPERLIIAGYTAREQAVVEVHIAELEEIGVPRPASVPAFYDIDPGLLTTDPVIAVDSGSTSGEVEPVVIRHGGRYFLGVGSDHTDRVIERTDIAAAKAACPKPLGDVVVELGSDLTRVDWDSLLADSSVDGLPYQQGRVSTLRHPAELMERITGATDATGDLVLFCGTLPLLGGKFVHGSYWRVHLELPERTVLTHAYETKQRSL